MLRRIALQDRCAVDDQHRVDAEKIRRRERHHDRADPDRAASDPKPSPAPAVLYVLAFRFVIEAHGFSPFYWRNRAGRRGQKSRYLTRRPAPSLELPRHHDTAFSLDPLISIMRTTDK